MKRRRYALFLKETDEQTGKARYIRVWDWTTGGFYPSFQLDRARHIYQNLLLAPYTQGWSTRFELRPV